MFTEMFIIIVILAAVFSFIKGNPNCYIENHKNEYSFRLPGVLRDDYFGVINVLNTVDVIGINIVKSSYISAKFSNNEILIYTTPKFRKYEMEYVFGYKKEVELELELLCNDDARKELTIGQMVEDINNHPPVLNKDHYVFSFGMEIPQKYSLTDIQPIFAKDMDFTNEQVLFTLNTTEETNYIRVQTIGIPNYRERIYRTTLATTRRIVPPFRRDFLLTATDDKTPSRNYSAIITLVVRSEFEAEFPRFIYKSYLTHNNTLILTEPIIMTNQVYNSTRVFIQSFPDYFSTSLNTYTGLITLKIVKPLPPELFNQSQIATLQMEATVHDYVYAKSVLLIYNKSPDNLMDVVRFSKASYEAYVLKNDLLLFPHPIDIINGASSITKVHVKGYESYFSCHVLPFGFIKITLHKRLPDAVFNSTQRAQFLLEASNTNAEIATAILIVHHSVIEEGQCTVVDTLMTPFGGFTLVPIILFILIFGIVFFDIYIIKSFFQKSNYRFKILKNRWKTEMEPIA